MIEFNCQSCNHKFRVRDDISGRKIKCQACGKVNIVPGEKNNIKINCQKCNHEIIIREDQTGKNVSCSYCGEVQNIPQGNTVTPVKTDTEKNTPVEDTAGKSKISGAENPEPDLILLEKLTEGKPVVMKPASAAEQNIEKNIQNIMSKYIVGIAAAVLFVVCVLLLMLLNKAEIKDSVRSAELANKQAVEDFQKELAVLNEKISNLQKNFDEIKAANGIILKDYVSIQEKLASLNKNIDALPTARKPAETIAPTEARTQIIQETINTPAETIAVQSNTQSDGRIVDKIDYPFVTDPQIIGRWLSVDFVDTPEDFLPNQIKTQGELFFKELVAQPKGVVAGSSAYRWTKGLIIHTGNQTASKYIVKRINGSAYLFFEWKSGDYFIRHMTPKWYVLKKS
jgi:DNA-directed RNA polymerase subunit RPC12/RpoP